MGFIELLQKNLERRTSRVMALLTPDDPSTSALPFAVAPPFLDVYGQVLRLGAVPLIASRRQIQLLGKQFDWETEGQRHLVEILKQRSNPVFDAWDSAWDGLWGNYDPNRQPPPTRQGPRDRARSGHAKGGLARAVSGLFGNHKDDSVEAAPPQPAEPKPVMAGLRAMIEEHAGQHGYLPPREDDVALLKELIRVHPRTVEEAWRELTQVHAQEFRPIDPKEKARQGALREAMIKWQYSLPTRLGELLILKSAADLEYCDADWVRQYIRQSARTLEEGERAMPYLTLYQKTMRRVIR